MELNRLAPGQLTTAQIVALNRMPAATRVVDHTAQGDPIVRAPRSGTRVVIRQDGRLALDVDRGAQP